MQIREYQESDLAPLRALHSAQGFDYAFPDLRNPLFVTKLVVCDASEGVNVAPGFSPASSAAGDTSPNATLVSGAIPDAASAGDRAGNCNPKNAPSSSPVVGAAFLRLTAEAYLFLDPHAGTPQQRWHWLLALHAAAERDAWQRGLEDVHAWLPPPIAQRFGKRITRLGWRRDDSWTPYCKKLAAL
jgi:hypothetical protein